MSELTEKVYDRYVARRGVMGGPDDTPEGHGAALASAKLALIREMLDDPVYDYNLRSSIREVLAVDLP